MSQCVVRLDQPGREPLLEGMAEAARRDLRALRQGTVERQVKRLAQARQRGQRTGKIVEPDPQRAPADLQ